MAVELDDLVDSLDVAINVPGAARPLFDMSDHEPWITALASAFWTLKRRNRAIGLWTDFRVNVDGDAIVNVSHPDDETLEMEREDQQVVVLQAALSAIETQLLSRPTHVKNQAGPVSTEVDHSSTVDRQLLEDRRAELEDVLKSMRGGNATRTYVIDAVLQRSGFASAGLGLFVN